MWMSILRCLWNCRWKVDDATKTITLQGLLALCPGCHSVKHMHSGATTSVGGHAVALKHLGRINEWSLEEVQAYVAYVKRCVCVCPLALCCAGSSPSLAGPVLPFVSRAWSWADGGGARGCRTVEERSQTTDWKVDLEWIGSQGPGGTLCARRVSDVHLSLGGSMTVVPLADYDVRVCAVMCVQQLDRTRRPPKSPQTLRSEASGLGHTPRRPRL